MKTILLGHRPEWRETVHRIADFDDVLISDHDFNETTVELPDIDLILPLALPDYQIIRRSSVAMNKSLVPALPIITLADDKLAFNKWLINNGYRSSVPRIFPIENLSLPLIRKKRIDEWGKHSKIVATMQDLLAPHHQQSEDYFLQEYVKGREEYVTHMIAVNGLVIYATTFKNIYDSEVFIKGGSTSASSVQMLGGLAPPELSSILAKLRYTGCACFNYKYSDGIPMIFELNPRVGGSFTQDLYPYLNAYAIAVGSKQKAYCEAAA